MTEEAAKAENLTRLLKASQEDDDEYWKRIITANPNLVNWKDDVVNAPLVFLASECQQMKVLKYILTQEQLDPNEPIPEGTSAIHHVASFNKIEVLELLLQHPRIKVDLQHRDKEFTALIFAIAAQNKEIIKLLLSHKANPNFPNTKITTSPLVHACCQGSLDIVKMLVEAGADLDVVLPNPEESDPTLKFSALYFAAELGHLEICQYLVEKGASIDIPEDNTPLFAATCNNKIDIVKYLGDNGANLNMKYHKDSSFPLLISIQHGFKELVEYFLSKKVEMGKTENFTPLSMAILKRKWDIAALIIDIENEIERALDIEFDDKSNILIISAFSDDHSLFNKIYAKWKGDVNHVTSTNVSALWATALGGNLEGLKKLIAAGADINSPSDKHITPLLAACEVKFGEIAMYLLERGAKIDANDDGVSPLMLASQENLISVVEYLLKLNCAVNECCFVNGSFPLYLAALSGNTEIVKLLLDNGAELDKARESDNTTALFIATQNGRLETAKYLLERGADPNTYFMPNKITCFVKACFEGRVEIAKEMLKTGKVNLRVLNYRNNNVLQLCTACLENRYDSVVLLLEQKEILDMINDNTEGYNSLHFALLRGNTLAAKLLVEKGARIETQGESSHLQYCIDVKNLDFLQYIFEHPPAWMTNHDLYAAISKAANSEWPEALELIFNYQKKIQQRKISDVVQASSSQ